jgi:hypothetical protein
MRWNAPRVAPVSLTTRQGGPGSCFGLNVKVVYLGGPQMAAAFPRKRRLSGEALRALELLVDQRGTTEALMLAHGFTDRMLGRLARAGLITIRHEVINANAKPIEVGEVRITYGGRRALEGWRE